MNGYTWHLIIILMSRVKRVATVFFLLPPNSGIEGWAPPKPEIQHPIFPPAFPGRRSCASLGHFRLISMSCLVMNGIFMK